MYGTHLAATGTAAQMPGPAGATRPYKIIFFLSALCAWSGMPAGAAAQARYDGHELEDRFVLRLGGYEQTGHQTEIHLDARDISIGFVLDLEDNLNIEERTDTVLRVDGHYRFNDAHRIEWTWWEVERAGVAEIFDEHIEIGDEVFRFGSSVLSESEFGMFKLGYAGSIINTESYEFYVGAGLNFYKNRLALDLVLYEWQDVEVSENEAEGEAPLPSYSLGMRFNLTEKLVTNLDYAVSALELGEYEGQFRELLLRLEHNTWEHAGFGLAYTDSEDFIEAEDERLIGEFQSSYHGLWLYLKTWF